jgi:hypothetical protein
LNCDTVSQWERNIVESYFLGNSHELLFYYLCGFFQNFFSVPFPQPKPKVALWPVAPWPLENFVLYVNIF